MIYGEVDLYIINAFAIVYCRIWDLISLWCSEHLWERVNEILGSGEQKRIPGLR